MLLADDLITQVTQAIHSAEYRNLPGEEEPFELIDPVARLTTDEQEEDLFPAIETEQDSQIDVMTSTAEERALAKETYRQQTPGSSASFQSAQAATMPSVKGWFAKWGGGPNGDLSGFIPTHALKKIEGGNHFMRSDAARAWKAMNRAAKKDGIDLTITDSYRDYDTQVRLKKEKPSLAATPGHSNHGWGLANDVNVNDPQTYAWLKANAKRFGFEQPMDYEPWHWEYGGGFSQVAKVKNPKGHVFTKAPKGDPLNKLGSSLVTAPMVFGSIMGEVYEPKTIARGRKPADSPQGLGFVPAKYRSIIRNAAEQYGLSARLLAVIAKHESGFDPKAVSSAGAQGLFQIMPLHGMDNPFNAKANAMKGAEIFANYLNLANGNLRLALAYYNAGPNADRALIEERMRLYSDPILKEFRGG